MSVAGLIRVWIVAALCLGCLLLAVAVMYWALPADELPTWLPGHKPSSHPLHGHHHKRHGAAAFLLGFTFLSGAYLMARGGDGSTKPSRR